MENKAQNKIKQLFSISKLDMIRSIVQVWTFVFRLIHSVSINGLFQSAFESREHSEVHVSCFTNVRHVCHKPQAYLIAVIKTTSNRP